MMNKEIDPVCEMALNPFEALGQSSHEGKIYYFCSQECKEKFDRRPEWYVEQEPEQAAQNY